VKVTSSSIGAGSLGSITGNKSGVPFYTRSETNSWIQIQFDFSIRPTQYTLGTFNDGNGDFPQNWRFEGSNGILWTTITHHRDDKTLDEDKLSHTWEVDCQDYFTAVRILQDGPNAIGRRYLQVCGVEIYGDVK